MTKNQGLKVEIVNDRLVISIGISTLVRAISLGQEMFDHQGDPIIKTVDENIFSKDILYELIREEEDGTTLVHKMLDEAANNAIDQGSEGIEIRE